MQNFKQTWIMRKKRKKTTTSGRNFMEIIDDVSRHA